MNYCDLFSGIGGFAIGAHEADMEFENHYYSETDESAIELYQKRFPYAISLGDIREIDCEELVADAERKSIELQRRSRAILETESGNEQKREIDQGGIATRDCSQDWIITGGFPCQDISTAGRGEGITGSRSSLWFEMLRIISGIRPKYIIIENVGAITAARRIKTLLIKVVSLLFGPERIGEYITWPRKPDLLTVLEGLAEIGYDAEWQNIRAEDMGAPHKRERIWIVAYPNGESESRCIINEKQRQGKLVHLAHAQERTIGTGLCEGEQTGQRGRRLSNSSSKISDPIGKHDDNTGYGASEVCGERSEPTEVQRRFPDTQGDGRQQTGAWRQESSGAPSATSIFNTARPIGESRPRRRRIWEGDLGIDGSYWAVEPELGRLAHGVPRRVDRLRGLGNSIVPEIAIILFRLIKAWMEK